MKVTFSLGNLTCIKITMKNLYNITKGQLITLWIFGVIGELLALDEASSYKGYEGAGFIAWILPMVLIFYTLGWLNDKNHALSLSRDFIERLKGWFGAVPIFNIDKPARKIGQWSLNLVSFLFVIVIVWLAIIGSREEPVSNETIIPTNVDTRVTKVLVIGAQGASDETRGIELSSSTILNLGTEINNDFGYTNYNPAISSGSYLKVVYEVKNTRLTNNLFDIDKIYITDQKGREYSPTKLFTCFNPYDSSNIYDSPFGNKSYSETILKPGIPCKVSALFEVAPDSNSFLVSTEFR